MNIKPLYRINKFVLPLVLCLALFSCVSNNPNKGEEVEVYRVSDLAQIQPVAIDAIRASAATLSNALSTTIDTAGFKEAIAYCNLNANHLLNNISEEYGVTIKRTSSQLRNAANTPSDDEQLILDFYASQESLGKECVGEMSVVDGIYKYYQPIFVMDNCTKCHGIKGETLNKKASKKIAELYPNDQATGYEAGDVRGLWVVTFKK